MALNPFKIRLHLVAVPLLNLTQHILNDILVFDRLPSRRLPSIAPPIYVPGGDAVDGIFAVGDDDDVAVRGGNFKGA